MRPSPPYLGLILAATGKLEAFLAKGCQAQRQGQDDTEEFSSDEEDDAVLANLVKSTFIKEITPKKESESQSSMDSPRSTSPNWLKNVFSCICHDFRSKYGLGYK